MKTKTLIFYNKKIITFKTRKLKLIFSKKVKLNNKNNNNKKSLLITMETINNKVNKKNQS